MSHWDAFTDTRAEVTSRADATPERARWQSVRTPSARARDPERTLERQGCDWRRDVQGRDRVHRLRDSEWETLRTIGTFRVATESDLIRDARDEKVLLNDLTHLVEEGLLDRKTGIVHHHPARLLVLTSGGKALLDRHQDRSGSNRAQQYHSGLVKPRKLAHDVQLYRAYRAERHRIEADGGRVTRVVLDYELKRDYRRFLDRSSKPKDKTFDEVPSRVRLLARPADRRWSPETP